MGCCFSSSNKRHRISPPCSAVNGRDPPPLEEETVKEVLSETPIPKPRHPTSTKVKEADFPQVKIESTAVVRPRDEMKFESTAVVKPEDDMEFESTAVVKHRDEVKIESTAVIKPEVSEELSEMCSFTESYSTTATATEKRDEDGEVTQRSPIRVHRKRQNSGDLAGVRERTFRSPAGRSAPSPEKRRSPASSRGVQGRGMLQQRRNVGPTNGTRRGPAADNRVVRRSNSPATRGTVDGRRNVRNRSPAARESGRSPAAHEAGRSTAAHEADRSTANHEADRSTANHEADRSTAAHEADRRTAANEADRSKVAREGDKSKEEVSPETGESLENPLVSMECFIFL